MALSYFSVPLLPRGHLVCMKKGSRHFFPAKSPLRSRSPDRGQHPPRYVLIVYPSFPICLVFSCAESSLGLYFPRSHMPQVTDPPPPPSHLTAHPCSSSPPPP